jgi:hypothetical protein
LDIREVVRRSDELDVGRGGRGGGEVSLEDDGEAADEGPENTCESEGRDFERI